jgi:hypothetical protein
VQPHGSQQDKLPVDYEYKVELLDAGGDPPKIDTVELGVGRNDGVLRLYSTRVSSSVPGNEGYEYSSSSGVWLSSVYITADDYCSSPVIADLTGEGLNTVYLGDRDDQGVLMIKYDNGWPLPPYSFLPGSEGKGRILAMKAGDGRNDGADRLYVSHMTNSGLVEYSWNVTTSTYDALELIDTPVGRIGIGQGRNDGINRIYVVERGGTSVHEFTWDDGQAAFVETVIFTGSTSGGSAYVADGRGDDVQRVYVWAGRLYELTWDSGDQQWDSLTMDDDSSLERFYIYVGSIRHDNKPCVYVSVKNQGLYEYEWSDTGSMFEADAITAATGGCVVGDGRGDGKDRLYAARGTKDNYTDAAVVEIWEDPVN